MSGKKRRRRRRNGRLEEKPSWWSYFNLSVQCFYFNFFLFFMTCFCWYLTSDICLTSGINKNCCSLTILPFLGHFLGSNHLSSPFSRSVWTPACLGRVDMPTVNAFSCRHVIGWLISSWRDVPEVWKSGNTAVQYNKITQQKYCVDFNIHICVCCSSWQRSYRLN